MLALRGSALSIRGAAFSNNSAYDSSRGSGGFGGTISAIQDNRIDISVSSLPL